MFFIETSQKERIKVYFEQVSDKAFRPAIKCNVVKLIKNNNEWVVKEIISTGLSSYSYSDMYKEKPWDFMSYNYVFGRSLAFWRATKNLDRDLRKTLRETYLNYPRNFKCITNPQYSFMFREVDVEC